MRRRPGAAPRDVTGSRPRVAARRRSSRPPSLYDDVVRRLIGWTAGAVGVAALARLLARSRMRHAPRAEPPPSPPTPSSDPADALRRKLTETRDPGPAAPAEAAADAPSDEQGKESVEDRRARVHAKAQEAIEAMQEPPA